MGNKHNYGYIARNTTPKIFLEKFLETLKKNLEKFFGEGESNRVLEALGTNRVKILSMENYLYEPFNVNDGTLDIYANTTSADEFFYESLTYFKKQAENGNSYIEVREFLLILIDMMRPRSYNISPDQLRTYIKILLHTFRNVTHESPFHLQLLEPRFYSLVREKFGLSISHPYKKFAPIFFEEYKNLPIDVTYLRKHNPKLEVLYPVYPDARGNQEQYLASTYTARLTHVAALAKEIGDLAEPSIALTSLLDTLEAERDKKYNRESILLELQRIKENNPYKLYPTSREFSAIFNFLGVPKATFNASYIKKTCVNLELFQDCLQPVFSNIEIDCTSLKMENLNYYIDAAKTLSLLRSYYTSDEGTSAYKITLVNVQDLSQELIDFIKKKIRQLRSITGREFLIDVRYDHSVIGQKFDKTKEPYIRVISDIHADYNKNQYPFNFWDDFIINCGDTAGNASASIQWLYNHVKYGVTVAGNHLGYGTENTEDPSKNTKSKQINILARYLKGKNRPLLLSNSETEYNGAVILGTTLFTDFALYGEEHIEEAMQYAKQSINDFKYITVAGHREYTRNPDGTWNVVKFPKGFGAIRNFTPQDHAYYFYYSYNFLKKKVEEYKDKPIIIVTHHAPSPYSISPEYAGSMLNPAFASNLNEFIISNPQIRLWCHGHVHSRFDYILGSTRVVCDPFGYNNENNADLPYNYGTRIKVADITSNEPWTKICAEEIKYGLIKVYEG